MDDDYPAGQTHRWGQAIFQHLYQEIFHCSLFSTHKLLQYEKTERCDRNNWNLFTFFQNSSRWKIMTRLTGLPCQTNQGGWTDQGDPNDQGDQTERGHKGDQYQYRLGWPNTQWGESDMGDQTNHCYWIDDKAADYQGRSWYASNANLAIQRFMLAFSLTLSQRFMAIMVMMRVVMWS